MHFECRLAGRNNGTVAPIWFYRYGFTIWIGRLIFGFGHDTRSNILHGLGRRKED